MFKFSKTNHFLIFVMFISLMWINCYDGCNCSGCGGCTSHTVVDKEKEIRKINGVKVKITIEKIKYKNRKLKGLLKDNLHIAKKMWFTVKYSVKIAERPVIGNICEMRVKENIDLENYLQKFNITFSPDKKSFAVGTDNEVSEFYHLLKEGIPYPSVDYYKRNLILDTTDTNNSPDYITFNNINWNKFPESGELFDTLIINKAGYSLSSKAEDMYLKLLNEMPPGNKREMLLINNWYNKIGKNLFTRKRVPLIIKASPKWKKIAILQVLDKIKNKDIYSIDDTKSFTNSISLVLFINDKKCYDKADEYIINYGYNDFAVRNYLKQRLQDTDYPPKTGHKKTVVNDCAEILSGFPGSEADFKYDFAIDILLITENEKELETFIYKAVRKENFTGSFIKIPKYTISKYDKYPKNLQKLIVKKYTLIAENPGNSVSRFDYDRILRFLKGKIPRKQSKEIYETHKSILGHGKDEVFDFD